MSNIWRGRKTPAKMKSMGNRDEFLNRISKSLYYSKLPMTDCLSLPVTELAVELFNEVKSDHTLERLDMEEASRISRKACISPCSLIVALLYLERLKNCNPEYLQRVAPSELFLTSLMVANKFLNDDDEDDELFKLECALTRDLTVTYVYRLEMEFLSAIDWAVFVRNQDFWERLQRLEKDIAYKEAKKRGWFSYTELSNLMNSMQLVAVAHAVINVSSVCLATYAAGIVTLLGSALVASYIPGTVLSPRQATSTTNLTKTELNPIVDMRSTTVDDLAEEVLSANLIPAKLICNRTQEGCETIENNETEQSSWKWWLNPMMVCLPEYSALEPKENLRARSDKSGGADAFLTATKFLLDASALLKNAEDLVMQLKWRQILGMDLKLLLHDWRHYANYVSKVTLGQQH